MTMYEPVLVRIKAEPPCRLTCPLSPKCASFQGPFDRSGAVGELAWIVQDMATDPHAPTNSTCGFCDREFQGRNIALEQGANLWVLLARDIRGDGSWDWTDCYTFQPDEVEVIVEGQEQG